MTTQYRQTVKTRAKGAPRNDPVQSTFRAAKSMKNLRDDFFESLVNEEEAQDIKELWTLYKRVAKLEAENGNLDAIQWLFARIMSVPKESEIKFEGDLKSGGEPLAGATIVFTTAPNPGFTSNESD